MLKAQTYSIKGTKMEEFTLPKDFGQKIDLNILAQAVRVYQERDHVGLRNTKTRSEVNRTGKKVYAQKGTGGARHGSRRANLFVGGGVIFGPRPLRRILTLNSKFKNIAKMVALSLKLSEKQIILVSGLNTVKKTSDVSKFIKKISGEVKAKRFNFVYSEGNKGISMFLRNLKDVEYGPFKDVNAYDVFRGGMLVLDKDIFK